MGWTRWQSFLTDLGDGIQSLFVSPGCTCPFCGRQIEGEVCERSSWAAWLSEWVCSDCLERFPFVVPPLCQQCGRPLRQTSRTHCQDCLRFRRFFSCCRALGVYEGALREWIHLLKYGGRLDFGQALGRLMADIVQRDRQLAEADCVLAIPASADRVAARGYDQAWILAQECAWQTRLPVASDVVARVGSAAPQSLLPTHARRRNAFGQFAVAQPGRIAGRIVLLVDDIFTTGATLSEVSRVLLRAGARRVVAVVAAIGVQRGD